MAIFVRELLGVVSVEAGVGLLAPEGPRVVGGTRRQETRAERGDEDVPGGADTNSSGQGSSVDPSYVRVTMQRRVA